jgi:lycopene beta-cyclase
MPTVPAATTVPRQRDDAPAFDVALVGAGLQNSLIALALLAERPELRLLLVERDAQPGGIHTWCFHAADLPDGALRFVEPLIEFHWPGYDVQFPDLRRQLSSPYAGFSAERLRQVLTQRFAQCPQAQLWTACEVTEVQPQALQLADGRRIHAQLVIDARGPAREQPASGYQKFVGHELRLAAPHGLSRPTVMDATVPQIDGFRFFYVLPLDDTRLLVEDTRFSDHPGLDHAAIRAEIQTYCEAKGFEVAELLREEDGVLPMPWRGEAPDVRHAPLRAGYAGGWMHPATGYSFPVAVRLANLLGQLGPERAFGPQLQTMARAHSKQLRFAHLLNRLLFRWFLPEKRIHVFERFYKLPEARIRRFYALQTRWSDRARLLSGRPPRGFSLRARLSLGERIHEPARL